MGALENVFGVGVQIDAAGKPIERGFGNLTEQARALAAKQLPVAKSLLQQAQETAKKLIADAQAEAEKIKASVANSAAAGALAMAPPTVSVVVPPNVEAAPPAAGALAMAPPTVSVVVPPNVEAAPPAAGATTPPTAEAPATGVKAMLEHVEGEIAAAMKNL